MKWTNVISGGTYTPQCLLVVILQEEQSNLCFFRQSELLLNFSILL